VVISRLRSYLKEIAVVRTSHALTTVGSSEFIVLRPTGDGLSAETLMVFLRCLLVQTVLRWSQDGSNHPRFAEEDLLAIPVPDTALCVQKKIDALVHEAIDAHREAARLLEQAKKTVEDMISGEAGGKGK
jgi:type I restriction enzyme S subunit